MRLGAPRASATIAIAIQVGVWLLVLQTALEMRELRRMGAISESELYGNISGTVMLTGSLGLAGVILDWIVVAFSDLRNRWFFWTSLILAATYLVVFPGGTILCAAFIIYLTVKRAEFFAETP